MTVGENGNLKLILSKIETKSLVRVRSVQKISDPANYIVILFLIKGKFIFET